LLSISDPEDGGLSPPRPELRGRTVRFIVWRQTARVEKIFAKTSEIKILPCFDLQRGAFEFLRVSFHLF
jgi:hypothetical protein